MIDVVCMPTFQQDEHICSLPTVHISIGNKLRKTIIVLPKVSQSFVPKAVGGFKPVSFSLMSALGTHVLHLRYLRMRP